MKNMGGMMNNQNSPFDFSKMMESMNNQNLGEIDNDIDDMEEIDEESDDYCQSCVNNDEN
jgi:hypothetical protein